MKVITSCAEAQDAVQSTRAGRKSIGLVPTMGALHEGHLSLVQRARQGCDFVAVSIFVNPTQFAPHEDFTKYPRTLDDDLQLLERHKVDLVFVPAAEQMYPAGFSTYIQPPHIAEPLEGHCRPGHFRGVATVVLKLFHLLPAHIAYFGQKDYQQALVVRRMVQELNVPMQIELCPTVREADGLAMSSRNRYLNTDQRQQALAIFASLSTASDLVAEGQRSVPQILQAMRRVLTEAQIIRIDYVAVCDPETLEDLAVLDRPAVALIAAYVGSTRLIDNLRIEPI